MHPKPQRVPARVPRMAAELWFSVLLTALVMACHSTSAGGPTPGQDKSAASPPAQAKDKSTKDDAYVLPRGKKLVLRDGTFQLVRGYQRNGDRVRYLSAERGDWEEIP